MQVGKAEPCVRPDACVGVLVDGDGSACEQEDARGDGGFGLVEVITAIALMALGVVAVMSGLYASVTATVVDRDHALAFSWLNAGADAVHNIARVPCTADGSGRTDAISAYDAAARTTTPPPGWSVNGATISVTNVEYLGRASVDSEFEWGTTWCFEGTGFDASPLYTQRVSLEVRSPDGTIIETMQMVKSE